MSRIILVGFDGSDRSQRAVDAAADLAGYGSTLTVVTVRNGNPEAAGEAAAAAREQLERRGVFARYLERAGDAAEELLLTAGELGADVIVLGQHPRSGTINPESVSERVVRQAECDVLLVR